MRSLDGAKNVKLDNVNTYYSSKGIEEEISIEKGDKDLKVYAVSHKEDSEFDTNLNSGDNVDKNDYSTVKEEKMKEAIEILNKLLEKRNSRVEIDNHDFFKNDLMIKIIDNTTGEVLVEVPPKKILDMIACMVQMAEGIVLDKKA